MSHGDLDVEHGNAVILFDLIVELFIFPTRGERMLIRNLAVL